MSSSRVQMTLIGRLSALETSTAWVSSSLTARRPNPPPRKQLWTNTAFGSTPPAFAANASANSGACVPIHTSMRSPLPMRGRVERLHRRVRQIGNLVQRLDHLGRLGEGCVAIAMAAAVSERPIERGAVFGGELGAIGGAGRAEVPFDRHRKKRFLGAPEIVGDDRHAIGHRHGDDDSAPPGDGGEVIRLELAAEHRAIGDRGIGHARQTGVDSEPRRAGRLERRVDALDLLADQLELIRRLDRGLRGERDLGGVRREFAEGRRTRRRLRAARRRCWRRTRRAPRPISPPPQR